MKRKELLDKLYRHVSDNKKDLFERNAAERTRFVTIVLENLFQPHNASAVMRSCDCFGIQDLHVIENGNEFAPNREIALGSTKWLNIYQYNEKPNNTADCLQSLKDKGYKIVATSPAAEKSVKDLSLDQPVALLLGTELTGLTDEAIGLADDLVRIPMYGFTESFNISVSAALLLNDMAQRIREEKFKIKKISEKETERIFEIIL